MITDFLIYIFSQILNFFAGILPTWQIPASWFSAATYFFSLLDGLKQWAPVFATFLALSSFLLIFLSTKYTVKIIISLINWFRGSGPIEL